MIKLELLDGRTFHGHNPNEIAARKFGKKAFFKATQNPNDPYAGEIMRKTGQPRLYKRVAVVKSLERVQA